MPNKIFEYKGEVMKIQKIEKNRPTLEQVLEENYRLRKENEELKEKEMDLLLELLSLETLKALTNNTIELFLDIYDL